MLTVYDCGLVCLWVGRHCFTKERVDASQTFLTKAKFYVTLKDMVTLLTEVDLYNLMTV